MQPGQISNYKIKILKLSGYAKEFADPLNEFFLKESQNKIMFS